MNGHSEADQANNNNTAQGQQHRQLRRTPPHSAPSGPSSSQHHQSELFRTLLETDQNHDGQSESSSISEIYMQGGERGRARTPFMRPQPSRMYRDSFEDFRSPSPYGSEDSNNSSVWARRSVTSPRNSATNGPRINAGASPVTGPSSALTRSESTKTPYHQKSGRDRNGRWSSPGPRDSGGGSSPRSVRRTKSMTSHHATHKTSRPASQTSSVDRDKAVKRLVHVGDRVLVNMGKKPGRYNTECGQYPLIYIQATFSELSELVFATEQSTIYTCFVFRWEDEHARSDHQIPGLIGSRTQCHQLLCRGQTR